MKNNFVRVETNFRSEIWLALVTLILSFLIQWLGLTVSVKARLEKLSQPVSIQVNQGLFWLRQRLKILDERASTLRTIEELEQAYSQALAEIAELEALKAENNELKRLLSVEPKAEETVVASTIIAYGQPSLNLGHEAGLESGQPVMATETLVGLIGKTSSHQSQVTLLAQNQTSPLLVETQSGVNGLVVGDGQKILLTELTKTAEVKEGELVVTSGQEGINSQLVIGRILQIVDQPTAPTKQAILEQPLSFYDVSVVEVLL